MADFVKAAALSDIGVGKIIGKDLNGRKVALANIQGRILAFDSVCPHRGGPLEKGALNGDLVTCPLHGVKFNVMTGRVAHQPLPDPMGRIVERDTFEVKIEDGFVFVKV